MIAILWITLAADAGTLVLTVYVASKKLLLIDFLMVALAISILAAAVHQVLAGHFHFFILGITGALNLLLTLRLADSRRNKGKEKS